GPGRRAGGGSGSSSAGGEDAIDRAGDQLVPGGVGMVAVGGEERRRVGLAVGPLEGGVGRDIDGVGRLGRHRQRLVDVGGGGDGGGHGGRVVVPGGHRAVLHRRPVVEDPHV